MGTLVIKFGGASVGTTAGLTQVISIVLQEHERWGQLIVVASALEGVTDALLEAAHLARLSNRRGYRRIVATIRQRHLSLVEKLPLSTDERSALQADVDQLLFDMLDICQALSDMPAEQTTASDRVDAIIGVGERLAARIIAALLRENNLRGVALDTSDIIITDATFGNAKPDLTETQARIQRDLIPLLGRDMVPVVTGFIGGTLDGRQTTLGRGGSDYTASIVGICTAADEVWMWTDVDGLMSADPRMIESARPIPELTYDEAAEMAYFGARILHTRMVLPLREHDIPLRIKNVFTPQQPGTAIVSETKDSAPALKAVTLIHGVGLRTARDQTTDAISANVRARLAASIGVEAEMMIMAHSARQRFLTFIIPTSAGPDAVHMARQMLPALKSESEVNGWQIAPVAVITAIGANLGTNTRMAASILAAVEDTRIFAIVQGPSGHSLSLVMDPDNADDALAAIHALNDD